MMIQLQKQLRKNRCQNSGRKSNRRSAGKLNLMLTGQNYPDIVLMDRGNDIVNRYIEAGALLPLNDLIDEYGPDVKEMYGETLNKSRYTDGKITI